MVLEEIYEVKRSVYKNIYIYTHIIYFCMKNFYNFKTYL